MADMKNPVQELAEVKEAHAELTAQNAVLAAENAELNARIEAMEKAKAEESEEDKKKAEEEEEAKRKAKAEEDKEKEEETKALAAKVTALESFIKSPEFRASLVTGSPEGVPEGGAAAGGAKTLTMAEAVAEYNKIDPNDAKARAAYREAHKSELGL